VFTQRLEVTIDDEINAGHCDMAVAARLLEDYVRDLSNSQEVTFARRQRHPVWENVVGVFVSFLERQQ
jgi:hypothetical protein